MIFLRAARPGGGPFHVLLRLSVCAAMLALASCGGDGGTNSKPNPTPGISALNPAGVMQGSGAFTLTVEGSGFARGAEVRWGGAPRPTTRVSATRVTAQIAAADVEEAGTAEVSVFNPAPGGGASNRVALEVSQAPPGQITGISPSTLMVDVGGTVTVTGTGFTAGSRVSLGGAFVIPATVVSSAEVRFTLPAASVPMAGFAQVSVLTAAGVPSNPFPLAIANPVPAVTAVSPAEAMVEADSLVVAVTGTGFVRNTQAHVAGGPRTVRRTSPTELEVVLNAADLATTGIRALVLVNGGPGGGTVSVPVPVVNPAPTLASVTPSQALAGGDSLVVRVTGTGFTRSSLVLVGGSARATRYVSATALEVVLQPEHLDQAGTFAVTVSTPQPGGGTSAAVNLTLTVPVPVLESLPSYGASAGRPGFTLVVNGSRFLRSSMVRWNGANRPTRYISGTRLSIELSGADLASPGSRPVTVHTPGGGTTAARQVAVRAVGPATITSRRVVPFPAADVVYDPHGGRLYASLIAGAGVRANTVVAIDPATGEITGSVGVGSDPGRLALSDDGTTLWVALNGSGEVRRLSLPALTPGAAFSLGGGRVEDMRVMPGRPGTVAISIRNTCCSPRHEAVAIFDNGVRRARITQEHSGNNTITFGESAGVLYGYNTESSEAGFRTMRVSDAGVEVTRVTESIYLGNSLQYAGGRVYSAAPTVMDAGRHVAVGTFPAWGAFVTVDAALGRIFYVETHEQRLRVFDINTFQELGSAALDGFNSNHPVAALDRMVRWGTDGLAVSDAQQIYIYRTPIAGP